MVADSGQLCCHSVYSKDSNRRQGRALAMSCPGSEPSSMLELDHSYLAGLAPHRETNLIRRFDPGWPPLITVS